MGDISHALNVTLISKNQHLPIVTMQEPNPKRLSTTNVIIDLIRCKLCLNKLSNPKMLPCQHTFCNNCLEDHFEQSKSNPVNLNTGGNPYLYCPTCELPMKTNANFEVQSLPRNFYLDSFLQAFHEQNFSAETRCVNCQENHEDSKSCDHCQKVYCKSCWEEHLSTITENFDSLLDHLLDSEHHLERRFSDFQKAYYQSVSSIKLLTEKKIVELKIQEKENLKSLEGLLSKNEVVRQKYTRQILRIKSDIDNSKQEFESNDERKVEIYMSFHATISNILSEISKLKIVEPVFDSKKFKLNKVESEVPRVEVIENLPTNSKAMVRYYRSKIFCPKLIWTKCPKPSGLGIPPWSDDVIYFTTAGNEMVIVINRQDFKIVSRLSSSVMIFPYGITFCEKRMEIYISDKWKNCIHVFSREGKYKRNIQVIGSTCDVLRNPTGIAIDEENELVVCDTGNDRVIVLDPENGKFLRFIGVKNNLTEFVTPATVVTYGDKIIVGDSGTYRIKIFDKLGNKLSEFGSRGQQNGQFKSIDAITCDSMGFILVGDSVNERVQVFQQNGKLVRIFTSSGEGVGRLKNISGILVTPQFEIVISDYLNRRLQVF